MGRDRHRQLCPRETRRTGLMRMRLEAGRECGSLLPRLTAYPAQASLRTPTGQGHARGGRAYPRAEGLAAGPGSRVRPPSLCILHGARRRVRRGGFPTRPHRRRGLGRVGDPPLRIYRSSSSSIDGKSLRALRVLRGKNIESRTSRPPSAHPCVLRGKTTKNPPILQH